MRALLTPILASLALSAARAEVHIPAFTAYTLPDPDGARISQRGLSQWNGPGLQVLWYGQFKQTGELTAAVALRLPKDAKSRLKLTFAGQSREATVTGAGTDVSVTASFGKFTIKEPGFQSFTLESLNAPGTSNGDVSELVLEGSAAQDAHFNLKERRNAASVHLNYPLPPGAKVAAFYCEVTGVADPVHTYYMACGWHRGYCGMQVNSPTERRIIFSVWDSGNEGVDRNKVGAPDRVTLVAKGEGVFSGDFGNEGTGGHSHLNYTWKAGQVQRFCVTAQPVDATHTVFAGYFFLPDKQQWMLISAWKAPKDGGYMHGLYSFSENFSGSNGHLVRKALFGNQWIKTADGKWSELTTASFSHDPTGKSDRLDRFIGVENGRFFLSQGGFVNGFTPYGEKFTRPPTGKPPELNLPPLPAVK
jgi:hypothetical protein